MLDDHKGNVAVMGHMGKECFKRFQSSCGCADTDDGKPGCLFLHGNCFLFFLHLFGRLAGRLCGGLSGALRRLFLCYGLFPATCFRLLLFSHFDTPPLGLMIRPS